MFFFVWSWNELLFPVVLLISNENQTAPLVLSATSAQFTSDPTALSAVALLGVLPMVIFFFIFQRTSPAAWPSALSGAPAVGRDLVGGAAAGMRTATADHRCVKTEDHAVAAGQSVNSARWRRRSGA
ncbi:hypothetical protein [Kitasatospora sp. NBC_00315]|uniref:hypothetical protein n=1 Tax=Kitasatospora sp. NBC_00315 TaxID=2975963 RepID=UPI0032437591